MIPLSTIPLTICRQKQQSLLRRPLNPGFKVEHKVSTAWVKGKSGNRKRHLKKGQRENWATKMRHRKKERSM